ncbi:taste receptor type 2 member 41-like [Lissotriton helveticus]
MFTNLLVPVLSGIFCVMGLLGNVFIVSMNLTSWINTTNELNVNHLIVFSLGASNICLSCVSFAGTTLRWHWEEIFLRCGLYTYYFMFTFFLNVCSLWSATWLCLYYCMKIVNFNHPSLIWMKVRFPKMVPWLLMGSTFVSLIISIPSACVIHLKAKYNPLSNLSNYVSANISSKGTQTGFELDYGHPFMFIVIIVIASVAFIIFFVSALMIITSLYRHMR